MPERIWARVYLPKFYATPGFAGMISSKRKNEKLSPEEK
jgi:hypothetical protein